MQEVVDAFRLGGATSPDRASRIEDLGVAYPDEADELIADHVLLPGRREGTYYLSEAGYIARREDRKGLRVMILVAVILLVIGLWFMARFVRPT
jgi:hypothetical protein